MAVNASDVLVSDNSNYYNGSNAEDVLKEIGSQLTDVHVNVKSFGAKGDWNGKYGTGTDDTKAIRDAIAACPERATLVFPSDHGETYLIRDLITISKNINIDFKGATITTDTTMPLMFLIESSVLLRHNKIRGGIIDGNGLVETLLTIKDMGHYRITDMFFKGINKIGIDLENNGETSSNYEGFFENVYFSSHQGVDTSDTYGIYVNTSDCHFNNIVGTIGFSALIYNKKDSNFYSKVHGWYDYPETRSLIKTSASCVADQCYADTLNRPIIVESGGSIKMSQCKFWSIPHDDITITPRSYMITFNDGAKVDECVFSDCIFNGRYPYSDYLTNLSNADTLGCTFRGNTYNNVIVDNLSSEMIAQLKMNRNFSKLEITNKDSQSDVVSSIGYIEIKNPIISSELIDGNFSNTTNSHIKLNSGLTMSIASNVATCSGSQIWSSFDYIIDSSSQPGDWIYFRIKVKNTGGTLGIWTQNGATFSWNGGSGTISANSDYTTYSYMVKSAGTTTTIRMGYNGANVGAFYVKEAISINTRKNSNLAYYLESISELQSRLNTLINANSWWEGSCEFAISSTENFIVKSFPNTYMKDIMLGANYETCSTKVIPNGMRLTGNLSETPVVRKVTMNKTLSGAARTMYIHAIQTPINLGNKNNNYGKIGLTASDGSTLKLYIASQLSSQLFNSSDITNITLYVAANETTTNYENLSICFEYKDLFLSDNNDEVVYSKTVCKDDGIVRIPIYRNGCVIISPSTEGQTTFANVNIIGNTI